MLTPIKKEVTWNPVPIRIHCDCGAAESYERASDEGWHIDTEGEAFGAYFCASCSEKKKER